MSARANCASKEEPAPAKAGIPCLDVSGYELAMFLEDSGLLLSRAI